MIQNILADLKDVCAKYKSAQYTADALKPNVLTITQARCAENDKDVTSMQYDVLSDPKCVSVVHHDYTAGTHGSFCISLESLRVIVAMYLQLTGQEEADECMGLTVRYKI